MNSAYLAILGGLVAVVVAPALLAGGGFVIAIVLAVVLVVALVGGPKLWDLHMTRSMGERSSTSVRNLIQGDDLPGAGNDRNRRGR